MSSYLVNHILIRVSHTPLNLLNFVVNHFFFFFFFFKFYKIRNVTQPRHTCVLYSLREGGWVRNLFLNYPYRLLSEECYVSVTIHIRVRIDCSEL